jgi:hypothetical protein
LSVTHRKQKHHLASKDQKDHGVAWEKLGRERKEREQCQSLGAVPHRKEWHFSWVSFPVLAGFPLPVRTAAWKTLLSLNSP